MKNTDNWGFFDKSNKQHMTIMSLLRQAQWTKPNSRHGTVPNIDRLSDFLKSPKSPVNKPLKKMDTKELSKIISAFENIVKSIYK